MSNSSIRFKADAATSRAALLILIVFVTVNTLIFALSVDGAAIKFGGDAGSWYQPTLGLLKHGWFVDPEDPSKLLTFRPPLYPMFAASMLWLGGGGMWLVVVAQLVLLFATGWLARATTERCLPGYGNLILALVIFNPNALGTAHLFQSDTLYAFSMTAVFWSVFSFVRLPAWHLAIGSGMLLGLSLLVRTTGQYLIFVWPLALLFLGVLVGGTRVWVRSLMMGFAATAVAFVMIAPWMLHNQRAGEGFTLSSNFLKSYFIWDNIAYLEKYNKNIGQTQAEQSAETIRNRFGEQYGPNFSKLADREKYEYLADKGREQFFSYPVRTFGTSFGWAWAQYYGIPGVSNFMNLFGLGEETAFAAFRRHHNDNYIDAGLDALKKASPVFSVLTAAGFMFVFILRGLSLLGIVTLIRRRLWSVLLVIVAGLAYFTVIHLFVANSRYRLPMEPILFLLAVYGLDGWRRWRVSSGIALENRSA